MKKVIGESAARRGGICVGCGHPKQAGLILCWECFKYAPGNLKESGLSFRQWQRRIITEQENAS